jgi:hypothetical protein
MAKSIMLTNGARLRKPLFPGILTPKGLRGSSQEGNLADDLRRSIEYCEALHPMLNVRLPPPQWTVPYTGVETACCASGDNYSK